MLFFHLWRNLNGDRQIYTFTLQTGMDINYFWPATALKIIICLHLTACGRLGILDTVQPGLWMKPKNADITERDETQELSDRVRPISTQRHRKAVAGTN